MAEGGANSLMALVTFNRKDLESLIGEKLSESDYKDKLVMMGVPLERYTEEEVDFEVFPNRPDLLSYQGFKRSFLAFLGKKNSVGLKDACEILFEDQAEEKIAEYFKSQSTH